MERYGKREVAFEGGLAKDLLAWEGNVCDAVVVRR